MPVIALDFGGTQLAGAFTRNEGNVIISETQSLENRKAPDDCDLI